MIPIVIGTLGTVPERLERGLEIEGQIETIQTTALLKWPRILRRLLETWENLLPLRLNWKTISFRRCEKLVIIIIIIIIKENLPNSRLCCLSWRLKKSENKDKYMDLARELKKLWNMKVMIIPIVIGDLGTVTKGLVQGLEDLEIMGRVETVQTTALLRSASILRRVLETCGNLMSLKLQWETISWNWCEDSKENN